MSGTMLKMAHHSLFTDSRLGSYADCLLYHRKFSIPYAAHVISYSHFCFAYVLIALTVPVLCIHK